MPAGKRHTAGKTGLLTPAVHQVIYLSMMSWADRTSESKDRNEERKALKCVLTAADCGARLHAEDSASLVRALRCLLFAVGKPVRKDPQLK